MSAHPPHCHVPVVRLYEIRVRGGVGPLIMEAFPSLTARRTEGDTVLSGSLPDACALYGVLHELEALGLELIEIRRPQSGL
jgi:hypothetical protein